MDDTSDDSTIHLTIRLIMQGKVSSINLGQG